jgi:hypothetical protein
VLLKIGKSAFSRLRVDVARIATRVGRGFEWFFYDPNAFTFKGMATFGLQLLSILGVGITLQFLAHPANVVVENREPIACFDIALFEESYALRKLPYPKQLQDSIREVALRDWPNWGHHVLCWYINPRSAERLEEIRQLEAAMIRGSKPLSFAEPFLPRWIEHAKRMARAEDEPIDTRRLREFSASSFLLRLTDFSTPARPLNLAVVLKPPDAKSRYRNAEAWKDIRISEIAGPSDIWKAIEAAGLQGEDLAHAFEQFDHMRCFLSWIEVSAASTHAVASKVSIAIARRPGQSEFLGGTLQLNEQQRYFTGTLEKLLPRERFWALLKTSRPIQISDIEVLTDPTTFFDPHSVWRVVPMLGLLFLAWTVGNILARIREPHPKQE